MADTDRMWVPNPFYVMVAEFLVRRGLPLVRSRLVKAPPRDVLFEGEATLERGPQTVRGLLSLTPRGLDFTPGSLRGQGAATYLPFIEVEEVRASSSRLLGLIPLWPNAIKVRTRRGIFRFTVDRSDRDLWLREIAIAQASYVTPDGAPSNPA